MEIIITKLDGTSYPMTVKPHDTVGHLKIRIRNELGVPVNKQKLMFVNGQMTHLSDDTKPLSDYGLHSGCQVSLLIIQQQEPPTIQVFLKNEKGQTTTYDIKPNETVSDFKSRVEQIEGVPVSQQRLIHESKEMTTGRLRDYGVEALSTIFLTLRLRGG